MHNHRRVCSLYRRYRYTAYRQLARWVYQWLGQNARVVLPACAVSQIRGAFPSEDNTYHGFACAWIAPDCALVVCHYARLLGTFVGRTKRVGSSNCFPLHLERWVFHHQHHWVFQRVDVLYNKVLLCQKRIMYFTDVCKVLCHTKWALVRIAQLVL